MSLDKGVEESSKGKAEMVEGLLERAAAVFRGTFQGLGELAIDEDFQQKRRNEETKDLTELAAFGDRMKKKAPIGKQSK